MTLQFVIPGNVVPYVRMTQRGKFVNSRAQAYLASQAVLRFSGQMLERDPWGCRDLVAAAILHFLHTNDGGET
jgi:hypothetical protein